jgi:hypothetical protein
LENVAYQNPPFAEQTIEKPVYHNIDTKGKAKIDAESQTLLNLTRKDSETQTLLNPSSTDSDTQTLVNTISTDSETQTLVNTSSIDSKTQTLENTRKDSETQTLLNPSNTDSDTQTVPSTSGFSKERLEQMKADLKATDELEVRLLDYNRRLREMPAL